MRGSGFGRGLRYRYYAGDRQKFVLRVWFRGCLGFAALFADALSFTRMSAWPMFGLSGVWQYPHRAFGIDEVGLFESESAMARLRTERSLAGLCDSVEHVDEPGMVLRDPFF